VSSRRLSVRFEARLGLLAACVTLGLGGESSCGPTTNTLPPLGEVLVIVDTDAPVPRLVSRLRVDAFTQDGTWYGSSEFDLSDPQQWPTSFGVYSPSPGQSETVVLRLRAYPDGMTRDYEGERYQARPSGGAPAAIVPTPSPSPGEAPRLVSDSGQDITPSLEPQPLVTIDQLVLVTTPTDTVMSTRVVMRGACFGTMADLATRTTCVDTENSLVPLASAPLDASLTPPASLVGTFGPTTACTVTPRGAHTAPDGTPLYDEEVCVPGGAFIFGSPAEYGMYQGDAVPERVAIVDPFLIDRYEVTVAQWRQAVAAGVVHDTPVANDGPLATALATAVNSQQFCTYSNEPLGREDYPVNCVSFVQEQEFCQALGGDLPLEVEWEYASAQVGRTFKTPYPWGGNDTTVPTCADAVWGRSYDPCSSNPQPCVSAGVGPLPVNRADDDSTPGLGIEKLAGSLSEDMRDSFDSLGSNCWMEQPLHMPNCTDPSQPNSSRGGNWANSSFDLYYGVRFSNGDGAPGTLGGIRCVRAGVATTPGKATP
jgi:formylglycine-generating enzyme required for sulfatase activity